MQTRFKLLRRLSKVFTLFQCIGVASLVLALNFGGLLGGGGDVRMHVPWSLTAICMAQIADILLLGLFFFAVVAPIKRTPAYPWLRLLLIIVLPPYLLQRMQPVLPFEIKDGLVPLLALVWTGLLLLMLLRFRPAYRLTMRIAGFAGIFLSLFALTSILQILWVARWKPGPQRRVAAWAQTPQPPRDHPLLVWIVFDELSYNQVFEHRARDLSLPNFDDLRGQSTVFSNVQPVGYHTRKIIPSLFSGQEVDDIRYTLGNRLRVHRTGQHGWHALNGSGTVFHDAQVANWRTAVVGWYNPYCTIYADALDDCYWTNRDKIDGPMAQQFSFLRNTTEPLVQLGREISSQARADRELCNFDVRQRLATHLDLEEHMLTLLHTDQADLVFLHVAVPHSPNIWSRIDDSYTQTCDSSYLDNLALADRELGQFMSVLRSSPRWKSTTLIVQGDHSWRIDAWNWLPAWTDEDDAASHDVFDPRPALIVHQAGQIKGQTVSSPWPLLRIHEVVERVLHGQAPTF